MRVSLLSWVPRTSRGTTVFRLVFLLSILLLMISSAYGTLIIPMALTDDAATPIGCLRVDDTIYGLLITPELYNLPPGIHGFHVHQFPFCTHNGKDAGDHYDPGHRKYAKHLGPYQGGGHLGDLPVLIVNQNGNAHLPVLAPRLKIADLKQRALIIHMGGDNYSDKPQKMGGGGARIACGLVPDF